VTRETTLALHLTSDKNPAGKFFYRDMSVKGVLFSMPPKSRT
jgi:hypothetical protein